MPWDKNVGAEGVTQLATGNQPNLDACQQVIQILNNHFLFQSNEPFQTEMKPNTGETENSFITCLKEQAPYCGFRNVDREVCYVFIHTCPGAYLKNNKEVCQGPLSLAGTSDLVKLHESVVQQLSSTSIVPSDTVNKLGFGFKKSFKSSNNSQQTSRKKKGCAGDVGKQDILGMIRNVQPWVKCVQSVEEEIILRKFVQRPSLLEENQNTKERIVKSGGCGFCR
jgi:hypothetical protein